MPKFEGCIEAKEISLCPVNRGGGANQHAHVLMLKSKGQPAADPKVEKTPMPTEAEKAAEAQTAAINKAARDISNKIAGMSDVTKAYYLALDDAKQDAFLAKTADEMKAEADAAKAAADKVAAEAEAAKSGKTVEFLALEKRADDQAKEIEVLKAAQVQTDLMKRATTEFDGYPGGPEVVVSLLKGYAKLDDDTRVASEAVLKSVAVNAKNATKALGGRNEEDVSKAAAAQTRIDAEVDKRMAADKTLKKSAVWEAVIEDPAFADDVAAIG